MKRAELDAIKENIAEKKDKASDVDIIISEIIKLPYGQLKKVLTDTVLEILAKYGYTE